MARPDIIVTSGVAARNRQAFVVLTWGDQAGQLTPEEARQHALGVIQAADAAEFDAAFLSVVMDQLGAPTETAAGMLARVRNARGQPDTRSGREGGS